MKKITIIMIIVGLVFLLPLSAEEKKDEKKDTVKAKIKLGVKSSTHDGYQGKVNEYSSLEEGVHPFIKAFIKGNLGSTFFDLFSVFKGSFKDQSHALNIDFNRVVQQKINFDSLYHRLDHDPLTNMDTVSHARSAAYFTDFNPNDQYHITRSEFVSKTRITIPSIPFLKIKVDYRNEHRSGSYQARTLSKCSACHVVAKSRSIDNYNKDIMIGSSISIGKSNLDYSFTNNQFKENGAAPTNDFLKVEHPEKIIPVFDSRIGVGNDETLSFDNIPESKKNTHLIKAAIPVSEKSTISGQFSSSKVENMITSLKWKSSSIAGGFSTRFGKKGFFNLRVKHLNIDNDSVFVDIAEPVDVAGPGVGQTYAGYYGAGTFDYTRYSSLSRQVLGINANFRYRLNKKLRLRLGIEYKNEERDNFIVDITKTTTMKGQLSFRPSKQLKITLDGKFKSISDPFSNLNGGIAPLQQDVAYNNPFSGVQFFQWHADRRANLTNFPEGVNEFKGRIHWGPSSKFAINANFLMRDEKNDNINYTGASWERSMTQWGINMWAAITDKMPLSVSYYNYQNDYRSIFAIAALEGCGAGIVGGMTGTLTDMMGYNIDTQTVLVNLGYYASKKLSLHCNLNYNNSSSSMNDLALNESDVPFLPGSEATALDFDNYGGVTEYSKLEMKQMIGELGINYALSKKWVLNAAVYYYFYDDIAQYLFTDTEGKSYSFYAGFTWIAD